MAGKFEVTLETNKFNELVSHQTYVEKYSEYSLKYRHDVDHGTSSVVFSEAAPEQEIKAFVRSNFG